MSKDLLRGLIAELCQELLWDDITIEHKIFILRLKRKLRRKLWKAK